MELILGIYRTLMGGLLGLIIGSFLNVLIYRLPRHESVSRGRSHCPSCHHQLSGLDLVPVFSYLLLHRRCRYCHQPIAARYMIVELITGLFFAVTLAVWGSGPFSPAASPGPVWLSRLPDSAVNGIHIALYLILFCAFLVGSFIAVDRQKQPAALFFWIGIPIVLLLVLQPGYILKHLTGALLTAGLWFLLTRFYPAAEADRQQKQTEWVLLALTGLSTGLWAMQPALAVALVIVFSGSTQATFDDSRLHRSRSLRNHLLPIVCITAFVSGLFF